MTSKAAVCREAAGRKEESETEELAKDTEEQGAK